MERVNFGELQVNDLAIGHRARGRSRLGGIVHNGRPGAGAASGRLLRGVLALVTLGHFVSLFLIRLRGGLVRLGRAALTLGLLALGRGILVLGTAAPAGLFLLLLGLLPFLAALRGQYLDVLITDEDTALRLLKEADA